jgi:hypothetical protein
VEIGALVDEPLAAGIDDDAEGIVVLLEAVADGEVAVRRRVDVPLYGMGARPVAMRCGTELDGHAVAPAVVEAGATHLHEVPVWTEVAGAHLRVRFKAATSQHHGLGTQLDVLATLARTHALHGGRPSG